MTQNLSWGAVYLLQKIVAISLCVLMISFLDVVYAIPNDSSTVVGETPTPSNDTISIPEEFGTIEESYYGTNGKTIVYIQDAHDSLDAQESIAAIIRHLVKNNGVKTVFEEGYEGGNSLEEYFAEIEDLVEKRRVTYFFMDKLRISGAEYAWLNRTHDFDLQGADSLELHRKNVEWWQTAGKLQSAIQKDLRAMELPLRVLADKSFTKEMKAWMRLKERFDVGELDLLNYLKRLTSFADSLEWYDTSPLYTNLNLLLVAAKKEPNSEILEQAQAIDHQDLFREINRLENELTSTFLQSDRDRQILHYYKIIQLLKRLVRFEVTFEEYVTLRESFANFDTENFARFLVTNTNQSIVLSKEWEGNLHNALKFYELAEDRDGVVEVSLRHLNGDTAALVFGGFHKTNLKKILRKAGYSYVIITPKIEQIEKRHQDYYRELMQLGYGSVELPSLMATATRHPGFGAMLPKYQSRVREFVAHARSAARSIISVSPTLEDLRQVNLEMMLLWPKMQGVNDLLTLGTEFHARSEARTNPELKRYLLKNSVNTSKTKLELDNVIAGGPPVHLTAINHFSEGSFSLEVEIEGQRTGSIGFTLHQGTREMLLHHIYPFDFSGQSFHAQYEGKGVMKTILNWLAWEADGLHYKIRNSGTFNIRLLGLHRRYFGDTLLGIKEDLHTNNLDELVEQYGFYSHFVLGTVTIHVDPKLPHIYSVKLEKVPALKDQYKILEARQYQSVPREQLELTPGQIISIGPKGRISLDEQGPMRLLGYSVGFSDERQIQGKPRGFRTPKGQILRSEVRIAKNDEVITLEEIFLQAGPTSVFANLNSNFKTDSEVRQFVGELVRLKRAGADVYFYNADIALPGNQVQKVVASFPERTFHIRSGSFSYVFGSLPQNDNMNYVHYSRQEVSASHIDVDQDDPLYYVVGKVGSAAYSLYEIAAIRLKQTLPDRGIEYRKGIHWISDQKASWINDILNLQTHLEFAKAA